MMTFPGNIKMYSCNFTTKTERKGYRVCELRALTLYVKLAAAVMETRILTLLVRSMNHDLVSIMVALLFCLYIITLNSDEMSMLRKL